MTCLHKAEISATVIRNDSHDDGILRSIKAVLLNTLLTCLAFSMIYSCRKEAQDTVSGDTPTVTTKVHITSRSESPAMNADIFTFSSRYDEELDSYQRCKSGHSFNVISRNEGRKVLVLANNNVEDYKWNSISSYRAICNYIVNLADDDPICPIMSGEGINRKTGDIDINLEKVMSEVCIQSLRCEFNNTPSKRMDDVKVYLVNASSNCMPFAKEGGRPSSYLNEGKLKIDDLKTMQHPEMLLQEIPESVGPEGIKDEVKLYCYPNMTKEEGPGTPLTRLVIECKIDGQTWFYPISINHSNNGIGIERNKRYIYNIHIKSTGADDPDTDISPIQADINSKLEDWEVRDEKEIIY